MRSSDERKITQLLLQVFHRAADKAETIEGALGSLEKLRDFFERLSYGAIDDGIRETLRYIQRTIFRIERRFCQNSDYEGFLNRMDTLKTWILAQTKDMPDNFSPTNVMPDMLGRIVRVNSLRELGFINCIDGKEYFFYFDYVLSARDRIKEGSPVRFTLGSNRNGPCAMRVTII